MKEKNIGLFLVIVTFLLLLTGCSGFTFGNKKIYRAEGAMVEKEVEMASFNRVVAMDDFNVIIHPNSKEEKGTLRAHENIMEYLLVTIENDVLEVKNVEDALIQYSDITLDLYIKGNISSVYAGDDATVVFTDNVNETKELLLRVENDAVIEGSFASNSVDIQLENDGKMDGKLKCNHANISLFNDAMITLEGVTDVLVYEGDNDSFAIFNQVAASSATISLDDEAIFEASGEIESCQLDGKNDVQFNMKNILIENLNAILVGESQSSLFVTGDLDLFADEDATIDLYGDYNIVRLEKEDEAKVTQYD